MDRDVPVLGCIPVTPALPLPALPSPSDEEIAEAEAELFGAKPVPLSYANLDDVEADRKRMSSRKAAGNGGKALEPLLLIGEIR